MKWLVVGLMCLITISTAQEELLNSVTIEVENQVYGGWTDWGKVFGGRMTTMGLTQTRTWRAYLGGCEITED